MTANQKKPLIPQWQNTIHRIFRSCSGVSLLAFVSISLLTSVGCSGPDSVEGTARGTSNTPVIYDANGNPPASAAADRPRTALGATTVPAFITAEHFAVVRIDARAISNSPDYRDAPWSELESSFAKTIGESNSQLKNVKAVWFMLDHQQIMAMSGDSLWSAVVQFDQPVDKTQLEEAQLALRNEDDGEAEDEKSDSTQVFELIDDSTLFVGAASAFESVKRGATAAEELIGEISNFDPEQDLELAVSIAPIRPKLQQLIDMFSQFGGDAMAKYADLPEVLSTIRLTIDANNPEMLTAVLNIEDDELGKDIARQIASLMEQKAGGQPGGASGMAGAFGGLAGGMGGGPGGPQMLEPGSEPAMTALWKEIQDQELVDVRNSPGKVIFKMGKPESLKAAINAMVDDGVKQFALMERAGRMEKIAAALKSYHEEHKSFPSSDPVTPDESEAKGVPAQFSWRTALLPHLAYQELYDRFDFAKAWDDPDNLAVAADIPDEFATELTLLGGERPTGCRIHVPSGANALYEPGSNSPPTMERISDKKTWTAAVVEGSQSSQVPWTQPGTLDIDSVALAGVGVSDENGIIFTNAAFKMRVVERDESSWRAVISVNGDETMKRSQFINIQPPAFSGG